MYLSCVGSKTTRGPDERRHFEMESGNFQLQHEPFQECHGRSAKYAKLHAELECVGARKGSLRGPLLYAPCRQGENRRGHERKDRVRPLA